MDMLLLRYCTDVYYLVHIAVYYGEHFIFENYNFYYNMEEPRMQPIWSQLDACT